ncbi:MAG: TIGR01777 family protein [Candidatus Omnitrophica bacterium]|nr:TIGR01777 family protein [Candidatus Omnitrophota bacterium]
MKVVVTGATGFIGRALIEALIKQGEDVIVLSRSSARKFEPNPKIRQVVWNPENPTGVVTEVDGADAVINLAGEPIVGKRWNKGQKRKITESRINSTQIVANSIKNALHKPRVLVNASAVGYYGSHGNESLTEESAPGADFLAQLCKAWEAHAVRVEDFNVRVVRLRIGIVLDRGGGALKFMLPPFKMFMGGWLGGGNQWMSWIAREDLIRLILFCLDHEQARGAVNAVSPQAVTNKAFSLVLAQVLKRPCFMPVPGFALKFLLGEVSQMLLTGQRVIPKKAQELGFSFRHSEIRNALEAVLR